MALIYNFYMFPPDYKILKKISISFRKLQNNPYTFIIQSLITKTIHKP